MFLTVFVSVLVTLYILFCVGLYGFYYLIEVILDLPITGQSPCTAHTALKQLIEKLLKEAVNIPLLQKAHAQPATPPEDTTNGTYEDLLATAIINKVITSCQNNLPSSSSANSVSSRVSTSSRNRDDKEYFFGEETLDAKWKTTDLDTTSVSSLEEWLQSESSFGSKKYVDKITLMIKQDVEEVDHSGSENEEDDAEYFRSSSSLLNDSESNWFLQKRQFQGTHSPVPVPMLVPNPSTEAKVLIGDKPLDDTSDLSDVGSDFEESMQPNTTHSLLIQSKNLIGGGKGNFEIAENADVQSESSTDSGVKEVNGKEQKSFDIPESSKTDISLDDDNVEDSSFISVYSNTEKEAEYTEKYASLPRQILKASTPIKSHKETNGDSIHTKPVENGESLEDSSSDFEFVGGTYSKKEKEKWKHAVEMKNNPYSKENIERRIKRSNSSASDFGPDYYAKLAGKPSGGGKLLSSEINGVSWPPPADSASRSPSPPPELPKVASPSRESIDTPPPELPKDRPPPRAFIQSVLDTPPEPPKTGPPPRELIEIDGIHQALKAIVTPVEENMPRQDVENRTVPTNSSEVTSDSDLSFINFYDVEYSQVVKKSKNENIQIPIKTTPLGVSYKALPDQNGSNHTEQETNDVKEAPVAKPRVLNIQAKNNNGLFIKASSASKQRTMSPVDKPILRRHLSESSLIEESFDAPPKVLHQKKDNTLISKIYKDPKVRLFALHSREEIPGSDGDYIKPVFQTQRSFDAKVISAENSSSMNLSKARSGNSSDDGITSEYESGKTGKMSFFSSEEDLLSLNSDTSFRPSDFVSTKNQDIKLNDSLYTDQSRGSIRTPSPSSSLTPRTPSTKKFIYSSQEDLLSIDEIGSIPQRKDNTLISKIYKDPNVRNFALKNHREPAIPNTPKPRKISSSDDEHYHHAENKMAFQKRFVANRQKYSSYDDLSSAEISIETHSHQDTETAPSLYSDHAGGYNSEVVDTDDVARAWGLSVGKFSKSEMNINSEFGRTTSMEDFDNFRVSVRDLRKKFESNDGNSKPVISSLTARSLSKQVKEILKH